MRPLRRPHWLSAEVFKQLLERESPLPKCKHCGALDDLTVDHIKPRADGGTDALDNLQFLCRRCNSLKGTRADAYWGQLFYWDRLPSEDGLNNLRAAQKQLFTAIASDTSKFFRQSLSEIARLLYICAWVVGAGKTIGIAVAAWALNFLIQSERGKVRRVDRILVLCKEEAIRDQIAHDLPADLVSVGIVKAPPRVGIVCSGEQWSQQEWLNSHDVICACIQQLWQKDEAARGDIARILAGFPLIAIDEPHFAAERVAFLVEQAATSLCVGFTGTPIDRAGKLLNRMIGLSTYTYQDAVAFDHSLKHLDEDPELFETFVRELKIHDANVTRYGRPAVATDTSDPGYALNIKPAEAVCGAVVEELLASDRLVLTDEEKAKHRGPDAVMNVLYPRHAIVYFDNIATAENAAITQNQKFDADRGQFPRDQGWHAEVVHAGSGNISPKPLARPDGKPPHPWMRAYRTGKLDARCARILYCVDMAREGVNNPFCGLTGIACKIRSLLAPTQGAVGRQMRAVIKWLNGALHVPPEPLDRVRIVTHEAFGNIATIKAAFEFLCNMAEHFEALPGISSLLDAETAPPSKPIPVEPTLTRRDKIQILGGVEGQHSQGLAVDVENICVQWAPEPGPRRERVREWVKICLSRNPEELRKELRLTRGIEPVITVRSERLKHEPNDENLHRFIRNVHPELAHVIPAGGDLRLVLVALYSNHAQTFQLPRMAATTTVTFLARQIGGIAMSDLGVYYRGDSSAPFRYGIKSVKLKLDVQPDQKLKDKSDWDTPEVHALIRRPDIQSELVRWVIGQLIQDGFCPQLESVLSMSANATPGV